MELKDVETLDEIFSDFEFSDAEIFAKLLEKRNLKVVMIYDESDGWGWNYKKQRKIESDEEFEALEEQSESQINLWNGWIIFFK